MNRIQLNEDIYPITEFRHNVSDMIDKTRSTRRPILITQNGKGTAVLLDVNQYEHLLEKLELAEKITISEAQIREGKVLSHKEVIQQAKIRRKKKLK